MEAIRYGDLPEVKAKMHEVIDHRVSDGLKELLEERALASDHLADADLARLRAAMDEARARRLQPHYIELAFKAAFTRLGDESPNANVAAMKSPTCRPKSELASTNPSLPNTTGSHSIWSTSKPMNWRAPTSLPPGIRFTMP